MNEQTNAGALRPSPPPLPATQQELLSGKLLKVGRNLNDEVDDVHVTLWAKPEYRALHDAVYDEEAIEGSLMADNLEAAGMMRAFVTGTDAHAVRYPRIAKAKKATIAKALGYVTKRYGQNRNQRRKMVHGEVVNGGEE